MTQPRFDYIIELHKLKAREKRVQEGEELITVTMRDNLHLIQENVYLKQLIDELKMGEKSCT